MGFFSRKSQPDPVVEPERASIAEPEPEPVAETEPVAEVKEVVEVPEPVAETPEPTPVAEEPAAEATAEEPVAETREPAPSEPPEPSPEPSDPDPAPAATANGNGAAPAPALPPEDAGEIKVEKVADRAPTNVEEVDRDPDEGRMSAADIMAPTRRRGPEIIDTTPEPEVARAKVISFANQKGGVAKTTTTLNLAVAFAETGHDVLCIDLDPQGNLTMSQGIDPDKVEKSMYDVLVDHIPIREIIQKREIDIAVASIDLAGAEIAMSTQIGRERSLEKALKAVRDDYDFICIDTPPSLGLLTINALTASDKVIVPVQCEYLSMRGLVQLQNTLEMIRENLNPGVEIEGILPTMLDSRTVHAKEAVEILEENFGDLVFKSRIRKAVKFAEAPVRGSSVLKYDPKGNAAQYYRELADEVLTHGAAR
jgi:chromosome partitioning protein